jgi:hypothetical protein
MTETQPGPTITLADIESLMERVVFKTENPFGTTSTFIHAFLDDKFYLASGFSACVSPENFDLVLGIKYATVDAIAKAKEVLWQMEGYKLYCETQAPR